jgi:SAM-dependent methyltransferase
MDIAGWDARYRTGNYPQGGPTPLLTTVAERLEPGRALDLACGAGRNATWLAERGWRVTAVDASEAAIEILRRRAPEVDARVADLERREFAVEEGAWDLIAVCYYLQRDLFAAVKQGLAPGGVAVVIVHLVEPGHEESRFSVQPGELPAYFDGLDIVHQYEGAPRDPEHKRAVAELVVRRSP